MDDRGVGRREEFRVINIKQVSSAPFRLKASNAVSPRLVQGGEREGRGGPDVTNTASDIIPGTEWGPEGDWTTEGGSGEKTVSSSIEASILGAVPAHGVERRVPEASAGEGEGGARQHWPGVKNTASEK